MKIEQKLWSSLNGWETLRTFEEGPEAQLVLAFGDRKVLEEPKRYEEMCEMYPNAHIVSASSSGDILGTEVLDGQIVLTAVYLEKTKLKVVSVDIEDARSCFEYGEKIGLQLQSSTLVHVFLISDGQNVDRSVLVKGIASVLPNHCQITGGLPETESFLKKRWLDLIPPPLPEKLRQSDFMARIWRWVTDRSEDGIHSAPCEK